MVLCQLMVLYFFILLLLRYRNVEQNVFLHYFQNKSLDCIWAFMRPQNRVVVEHFLYLCPLLELSICTKYAEKNLKLKKKIVYIVALVFIYSMGRKHFCPLKDYCNHRSR